MTVEGRAKKDSSPEKKKLKARVAKAEARKAEIEVERAEIQLGLDRLRQAEFEETYAWKLNSDRAHGVFSLETGVGSGSVQLAADLRQYGRVYPEAPITLNIFSPGGSVLHGLALYDTLRTLSDQGHTITTVARGYAASMGSILFLAGDNRLIGSGAFLMFHTLSTMTIGSIHEIEDELEFAGRLQAQMDGIITGRTKITPELLSKKTKKTDWWCDAKQSKKLGAATQVI